MRHLHTQHTHALEFDLYTQSVSYVSHDKHDKADDDGDEQANAN